MNLSSTPPWLGITDARHADWSQSYTDPVTNEVFDLTPQRDNELASIALKGEWDFGPATLTSITSYEDFSRHETFEADGGPMLDTGNINTSGIESFSQELRVSGRTDNLIWIAGLFYSQDEVTEKYDFFMPDSAFGNASLAFVGQFPRLGIFAASPILRLNTSYEQDTRSAAIFGHAEWSFADRWRMTVGARYTDESRKWAGCTFSNDDNSLGAFLNYNFGSTLVAGDCGTIDDDPNSPTYLFNVIGTANVNDAFHVYREKISTGRVMGKFGLDYQITDDALLYFNFSRGFKSGGFNGASSNTTLQLKSYGPETLNAYEIGSKLKLLDGTMQLNASTFYYDYRDKQERDYSVTFVGNITGLTNVPKSRIMGAEVDLTWLPIDGLSLNVKGAWLDTKVLEWEAVSPTLSAWPNVVTFDASGGELAQAPRWATSGIASYTHPVGDSLYFTIGGDYNYTGATNGGARPEFGTEEYLVLNGRIELGSTEKGWNVQVWSRNLTDKYYYTASYIANGPFLRAYGMPRTIGVSLNLSF